MDAGAACGPPGEDAATSVECVQSTVGRGVVTGDRPGHSVLTDNSVRFVRLLRNSVSRYQEPIGVLQNQEPTSSASVFSVRFFGSTESTDPLHREGKNQRETPDWGRMGKNEGAAWRRACASSCSSRWRRHAREGCALGSPLALACAGRHSSLPSPKPQACLAVAVTPPPHARDPTSCPLRRNPWPPLAPLFWGHWLTGCRVSSVSEWGWGADRLR